MQCNCVRSPDSGAVASREDNIYIYIYVTSLLTYIIYLCIYIYINFFVTLNDFHGCCWCRDIAGGAQSIIIIHDVCIYIYVYIN